MYVPYILSLQKRLDMSRVWSSFNQDKRTHNCDVFNVTLRDLPHFMLTTMHHLSVESYFTIDISIQTLI